MRTQRYFLHGDVVALGEFYCARCDAFSFSEHFEEHGPPSDHWRKLRWHLRLFYTRQSFRFERPRDAVNLFVELGATKPRLPRSARRWSR